MMHYGHIKQPHIPYEEIHDILWAYRTTIHTTTIATPAKLIYSIRIVVLLRIPKRAIKFMIHIELSASQYQQKRLAQLNLLDEARLQVVKCVDV